MALEHEEWDFDCLDVELESLMEKHGFLEFQRALKRLELLNEEEQKTIRKNILLSEAISFYYNSYDFNKLKPSSQQAYRYEMDMYWDHCCEKIGAEPLLRDVSAALFLKEYLDALKKKPATISKKSAFLRSFF
jgi:hypothetical protein